MSTEDKKINQLNEATSLDNNDVLVAVDISADQTKKITKQNLLGSYLTSESDPIFSASQAANITEQDITNLGNLSGTNTGDQDLSGYVPYTGATADLDLGANNITAANLNISNWDTAYGWGDHSGLYESAGSIATHAAISDAHHARYTDAEVESVITAEIADGQSIDNAIDTLISSHAGIADEHHARYTDSEVESVISAELVDGQSIDLAIDSLIATHASNASAHHAKYTDAEAVSAIKADADWNATNWDTAYGWGDHSAAGYLTSVAFADLMGSPSDVITAGSLISWTGNTLNVAVAHSDLSGIGASDHHTKYALTDDLTAGEITQLQNIGATTISAAQWGYLGAMTGQPLEAEVNDLTAAVTWANVPDANITQSSVTQHEGAIDHDSLLNFAANEHIDWTNASDDLLTSGDIRSSYTYTATSGTPLNYYALLRVNPTGNSSVQAIGLRASMFQDSSNALTSANALRGFFGGIVLNGTGNVAGAIALDATNQVMTDGASFTNMYGVRSRIYAPNNFTGTTYAHFYTPGFSGGGTKTLTNEYGLLIDDIDNGTNNFAIKTNAGQVYFGDELHFAPGTSVTPANNGDVVIEATNNTTLTFKLKGSDGTVRSGTITLA